MDMVEYNNVWKSFRVFTELRGKKICQNFLFFSFFFFLLSSLSPHCNWHLENKTCIYNVGSVGGMVKNDIKCLNFFFFDFYGFNIEIKLGEGIKLQFVKFRENIESAVTFLFYLILREEEGKKMCDGCMICTLLNFITPPFKFNKLYCVPMRYNGDDGSLRKVFFPPKLIQ